MGLPKLKAFDFVVDPDFDWPGKVRCPDCGGGGTLFLDNGPSGLTTPCNECDGDGWIYAEDDR